MPLELFLYSKEQCEPCAQAEAIIASVLANGYDCVCHTIKIDGDQELLHRYGARVPVLQYGNTIISELGVDNAQLQTWLEQHCK